MTVSVAGCSLRDQALRRSLLVMLARMTKWSMVGRKDVGEQDREHDALGERDVDDADDDGDHADENTEDPPSRVRDARGDRVGGHEHHPERKSAEHQVPVPGHREHRIGVGADQLKSIAVATMPSMTPAMIRHEATPV